MSTTPKLIVTREGELVIKARVRQFAYACRKCDYRTGEQPSDFRAPGDEARIRECPICLRDHRRRAMVQQEMAPPKFVWVRVSSSWNHHTWSGVGMDDCGTLRGQLAKTRAKTPREYWFTPVRIETEPYIRFSMRVIGKAPKGTPEYWVEGAAAKRIIDGMLERVADAEGTRGLW